MRNIYYILSLILSIGSLVFLLPFVSSKNEICYNKFYAIKIAEFHHPTYNNFFKSNNITTQIEEVKAKGKYFYITCITKDIELVKQKVKEFKNPLFPDMSVIELLSYFKIKEINKICQEYILKQDENPAKTNRNGYKIDKFESYKKKSLYTVRLCKNINNDKLRKNSLISIELLKIKKQDFYVSGKFNNLKDVYNYIDFYKLVDNYPDLDILFIENTKDLKVIKYKHNKKTEPCLSTNNLNCEKFRKNINTKKEDSIASKINNSIKLENNLKRQVETKIEYKKNHIIVKASTKKQETSSNEVKYSKTELKEKINKKEINKSEAINMYCIQIFAGYTKTYKKEYLNDDFFIIYYPEMKLYRYYIGKFEKYADALEYKKTKLKSYFKDGFITKIK
ncbi:MAG: hypothetical protein N4A49_04540 [Marinifilaceae bacterium]|jgi:hypothetical protein|nr:hypothetical protein [Marinifilaceae bacterium]